MSLAVLSFAVLLAIEPTGVLDELENSFLRLKQAEAQKDAEQVLKLSAETCALARRLASVPAPEAEADKTVWNDRVTYARDVERQTEYALLAMAVQAPPAVTVDLMAALERQNPKSRYLDEGYSRYLLALNQTGGAAKIPAVAEKGLAQFPDNEDLLLVLADNAMHRQQSDRALTYSRRLVAVLSRHSRPEGLSAGDWERKKNAALARGYWITGVVCGEKNLYAESNRNLRSALPLIQGNDAMMAPALFYLGVVNYQLGMATLNKPQLVEAAKFSEQAAAYDSPYQQQAWRNAQSIKTSAARMR